MFFYHRGTESPYLSRSSSLTAPNGVVLGVEKFRVSEEPSAPLW